MIPEHGAADLSEKHISQTFITACFQDKCGIACIDFLLRLVFSITLINSDELSCVLPVISQCDFGKIYVTTTLCDEMIIQIPDFLIIRKFAEVNDRNFGEWVFIEHYPA